MTRKSTYEILYDNFLSKLPEKYAIKLGRNFLRLPIEVIGDYETGDQRLHTKIGDCELPNPVILSACYHEPHIIRRAMKLGFGAVTLKVTKYPKKGNPEPTIVRRGEGFVNCVGLKNLGLEVYRKFLKAYRQPKPLIINLNGRKMRDVIENLDDYADIFEVNISCPNTEYGLELTRDLYMLTLFLNNIVGLTKKPKIIKLSPSKEFEERNQSIANQASPDVDAINFGNTMSVEERGLSMGKGGLSGPELYENMLRNVENLYEWFRRTRRDIKIIATGGIDSPEKAYKAITKGATCVSYVTGFVTKGPSLAKRINKYLLEKLDEHDLDSIDEMVGIEVKDS